MQTLIQDERAKETDPRCPSPSWNSSRIILFFSFFIFIFFSFLFGL